MGKRLYKVVDTLDQLICEGTAEECAAIMKVRPETIRIWATPKHHEKVSKKPEPRKYNVERIKLGKGGSSKDKSIFNVYDNQGKLLCTGTAQECADVLKLDKKTIQYMAVPAFKSKDKKHTGMKKYKAVHVGEAQGGRRRTRYAVYDHTGEFVCEGTAIECAEIMNVEEQTIRYWASPAARRRKDTRKNFHGYTADRINPEEWEEKSNMKVNVDYGRVHEAIEALKNKDLLTDQESAAALKVLTAVLGDYVPTWDEYKRHNSNVTRLKTMDYESNPGRWQQVADEIREFENKYL